MSNLENVELEEKAFEVFIEGLDDNWAFRDVLAEKLLEGMEYYLYCKEDASHFLDDRLDDFFEDLLKWDWETTVRDPVEAARRYLST